MFVHLCLPLCINAALFESVPLMSPRGFGLILGSRLVSFVRVRSQRKIVLDRGKCEDARSESRKNMLFRLRKDGLVSFGSYWRRHRDLSGSRASSLAPLSLLRPQDGKTAA